MDGASVDVKVETDSKLSVHEVKEENCIAVNYAHEENHSHDKVSQLKTTQLGKMTFICFFELFFCFKEFSNLVKEDTDAEQINYDKLLKKNMDIMKEIQLQDVNEIPVTVIKKDNTDLVKSCIKPYTESQLSALYHNSELDNLDAFITQYVDAELKGEFDLAEQVINLTSFIFLIFKGQVGKWQP